MEIKQVIFSNYITLVIYTAGSNEAIPILSAIPEAAFPAMILHHPRQLYLGRQPKRSLILVQSKAD